MSLSFDYEKSSKTDEFWSELERDLGETIEAFGLGEHLSGWDLPESGRWFITFVTRSGVHFRRPAKNNWLGAMLGRSSSADREAAYVIPGGQLEAIEDLDLGSSRSMLLRFRRMFKADPGVLLRYRNEQGETRELVLRLETNRSRLLDALRRLVSGAL